MERKMMWTVAAACLLGGCVSGGGVQWTSSNSPSQCAQQIAQGKVPVSEQHDYVQKCSAGYRATHGDDADGGIKFDPVHAGGQD